MEIIDPPKRILSFGGSLYAVLPFDSAFLFVGVLF